MAPSDPSGERPTSKLVGFPAKQLLQQTVELVAKLMALGDASAIRIAFHLI